MRTWLLAMIAMAGLLGGMLLLRRVVASRLAAFATRTSNDVDDVIGSVVRGTRTWFLATLALVAGARFLILPSEASQVMRFLLVVVVVFQAALWGNLLIAGIVQTHVKKRAAEDAASATTVSALGYLARLLLWSVLLLLGLDNLGINITALVAGLGVGGIAVALAVQNILGDLFASLSIVLDKPFVNGDFIIVGDLMGVVEHIGLKTTRVRSLHGEQIIFSNADLLNSRIRNFKRMDERRVLFEVGVTYDTPPHKVAGIPHLIRGIIERVSQVRFDRAHFRGFGPYSLDFEIVYYVLDRDYNRYMDVQQVINLAILKRFEEEHIEFAFPTQTLHVNGVSRARVPLAATALASG